MNCKGCGQKIQFEDKNKPGYAPKKEDNTNLLVCQRCFKIKNYGNNISYEQGSEQKHYQIVKKLIQDETGLIVYLIDIFNFEISLLLDIEKISKFKKIYFVINKKDIMPKSLNDDKVVNWTKKKFKKMYANKIIDIDYICARDLKDVAYVKNKIEKYRLQDNVFVIGSANVGKSTFINSLLKIEKNKEQQITTSSFPGTTIEKIKIPLKNNKYIVDTPGIIYKNSFWNAVGDSTIKAILPKSEVKQIVYQLNSSQSIIIGGLAIFNYIKGSKKGFNLFFSNEITFLRCKFENKEKTFESSITKKQVFPIENKDQKFRDLTTKKIILKEDKKVDIVIAGLGWFSFKGEKNDIISIDLPANIDIFIRGGMI